MVQAKLKMVRRSPQKMRLVADMIRGEKVDRALNILKFSPKVSAKHLLKLLDSAIANAEDRGDMDTENLYVKMINVDGGPMVKRFRPRAMGRATRILKRTSHVTLELEEQG